MSGASGIAAAMMAQRAKEHPGETNDLGERFRHSKILQAIWHGLYAPNDALTGKLNPQQYDQDGNPILQNATDITPQMIESAGDLAGMVSLGDAFLPVFPEEQGALRAGLGGMASESPKGIPGAPMGTVTAEDEAALRAAYIGHVKNGIEGRDWFNNAGQSDLEHMGGDAVAANRFAGAQGVTSSNTPVDANTGFAIKAHNQAMAGDPIVAGQFPNSMGPKMEAIYAAEDPGSVAGIIGPKTGPMYENVAKGGGFATTDMNRSVHDIWDARAWGFQNADGTPFDNTVGPARHAWMDRQAAQVIDQLNAEKVGGFTDWSPLNTQAAAWIGKKAASEGSGALASRSYADFMPKYYGQGSYESVPGATTDHLPLMRSTGSEPLRASHMAETAGIMDTPEGRDRLALGYGAPTGPSFPGQGLFEGKINPGRQTQVALGRATGGAEVDPSSARLMDAIESTRGLLLGQDAAAWHLPGNADAASRARAFDFHLGRPVNDQEFAAVAKAFKAASSPEVFDNTGLLPTPHGLRVANFDFSDNASPAEFGKMVKGIGKQLGLPDPAQRAMLGGNLIQNDWTTHPYGQAYLAHIDTPAFAQSFNKVAPALAKQLADHDEAFAAQHGMAIASQVQAVRRAIETGGLDGLKKLIAAGTISAAALSLVLKTHADLIAQPPQPGEQGS